MRDHLRRPANQLTILRLALVPLLWIAAARGWTAVVGIGLIVAAVSDILDGYVARRLGQQSAFGSQLDSIADTLTSLSAVAWTLMFRPDLATDHPVLLSLTLGIALTSVAVGWARFRRIADLHLPSARAATVVGYPFVVHALLFDRYLEPLFYIGIAMAILASVEALVLQLTRQTADEPVGPFVRLPAPRGQ